MNIYFSYNHNELDGVALSRSYAQPYPYVYSFWTHWRILLDVATKNMQLKTTHKF